MSHEPYSELAAAYALGALEGDERTWFESHLQAGCPECEAAVRDYGETLGALAAELPAITPPAAIRTRLLERAAAQRRPAPAPRRQFTWRLAWAASLAAAAAVAAYLALTLADIKRDLAARDVQVATLEAEARRLREEAASLRDEIGRQRALLALLEAPETRVVALAGLPPSPAARGRMWWQGDSRTGFFVTSGLPALPTGKTYQLWVISGGKPVSAGTFAVDPSGAGALRVGPIPEVAQAEVFAVTLEPAGGLPAPSGAMYLAGKSG